MSFFGGAGQGRHMTSNESCRVCFVGGTVLPQVEALPCLFSATLHGYPRGTDSRPTIRVGDLCRDNIVHGLLQFLPIGPIFGEGWFGRLDVGCPCFPKLNKRAFITVL